MLFGGITTRFMTSKRKKTQAPVRLAIIGTGGMARKHAMNFGAIPGCRLAGACDIDSGKAEAFAREFRIENIDTDPGELLRNPEIDAVSIVTPDSSHASLSIQSLKAGKHVLCEKPLALNYNDAKKMVAAAGKSGLIHMVNLSYRDWPAIQAIAKLIEKGRLGELRHLEAGYLQAWLANHCWGDWKTTPQWLWRLSTSHGSNGVLGDLGVHIVDFATFPAGPIKKLYCQLHTFPKVKGNRIGPYRLDANDSAIINATFKSGAIGVIHTTRWFGGHANRLTLDIAGTQGSISFDSDMATDSFRLCSGRNFKSNTWEEVKAPSTPSNYERFIRAIQTGRPDQPSFVEGAEAQKVLDACFASSQQDKPLFLR